jgi:hypothetical protein
MNSTILALLSLKMMWYFRADVCHIHAPPFPLQNARTLSKWIVQTFPAIPT